MPQANSETAKKMSPHLSTRNRDWCSRGISSQGFLIPSSDTLNRRTNKTPVSVITRSLTIPAVTSPIKTAPKSIT